MQNFSFDSTLSNYLNQSYVDPFEKNPNTRRRSLGNLSTQNTIQNSEFSPISASYSFQNMQPQSPFGFGEQRMTPEPKQNNFSSLLMSINNNNNNQDNPLAKSIINQQIQQQSEENLSNFIRMCNYSGIELNNQQNRTSSPGQQQSFSQKFNNQNVDPFLSPSANKLPLNMRRRSFGPSSLRPVQESRSSSPVFSYAQQYQQQMYHQQQQQQQQQQQIQNQLRLQQQQQLEEKLNMLVNTNYQSTLNSINDNDEYDTNSLVQSFHNSNSSINTMNTSLPKSRLRAMSIGSANPLLSQSFSSNSISSMGNTNLNFSNKYGSCLSLSSNLNSYPTSTNTTNSTSNSNSKIFDSFEEKLATTGNIFQRRDDWSIINKVPIKKQNTIHIRLEDEGPYGNDETRCFVLSHFSSLGIKNISCIFCSCDLVIYDRFPLIDGTLFLSPVNYDKAKSIPSVVTNKQQYIYAVCLKCLTNNFSSLNSPGANGCCGSDHEVVCKFCSKSWQKTGGSSLQIGTLYKYDIFASFPCCASRLTCSNSKCNKIIMDVETAGSQYFSSFSEEKECPSCKVKAYHFIKPLKEIFLKSQCELRKENEKEDSSLVSPDSTTTASSVNAASKDTSIEHN